MDAVSLIAALAEMRPLLGSLVRSVAPAGPAALWIELLTERGSEGLLFCADPACAYCVRGGPRPAKRPLTPLEGLARRMLSGSRLDRIAHEGMDRVCRFVFDGPEGEWQVIVELFGTRPNIILVDAGGKVQESARHDVPRTAIGALYTPPPMSKKPDPRLLGESDTQQILAGQAGDPAQRLQALAGISEHWAEEIVARATDASPAALSQALLAVIREAEHGPSSPQVVLDPAGIPAGVAPFPLRHLPPDRLQPAGSLYEATQALHISRTQRGGQDERQRAIRVLLRRMAERFSVRRIKLEAEAKAFAGAELQQRMGALLVANQRTISRGATEVVLADPSAENGATLTIPLDPALSPAANAERLFKQARRGRRGIAQVTARLADTETALGRVQHWTERLAADPDAAGQLETEIVQSRFLGPRDRATLSTDRPTDRRSVGLKPITRAKPPGGPAPRHFVSSEGFPILVGRNNEGNDYLTLHLARSEDLWLHAQNRAGSHVVVQVQNRQGGIPRRTLLQAAQLAAYYSQARNEGKVEVSYTLKKYVRKPRKAPPGLVTITQEKTVRVSPDKSLVAKLAAREENGQCQP